MEIHIIFTPSVIKATENKRALDLLDRLCSETDITYEIQNNMRDLRLTDHTLDFPAIFINQKDRIFGFTSVARFLGCQLHNRHIYFADL